MGIGCWKTRTASRPLHYYRIVMVYRANRAILWYSRLNDQVCVFCLIEEWSGENELRLRALLSRREQEPTLVSSRGFSKAAADATPRAAKDEGSGRCPTRVCASQGRVFKGATGTILRCAVPPADTAVLHTPAASLEAKASCHQPINSFTTTYSGLTMRSASVSLLGWRETAVH